MIDRWGSETEEEKEARWRLAREKQERSYRLHMDKQEWVHVCPGIEIRGPQAEELAVRVSKFIEDYRWEKSVHDEAESKRQRQLREDGK